MRTMKLIAPLLLAIAAMITISAAPASAAPLTGTEIRTVLSQQATTMRQLQQQIDLQLKFATDGRQTAVNEVSYSGGKFVVTYALPNAGISNSPDCPSNWYCFYDRLNFGYPRGRLSDCGWQDLANWGWNDRIESVHNNTTVGVNYINHFDDGNPANGHSMDYALFYSAAHSSASLLTFGTENRADHVNRKC